MAAEFGLTLDWTDMAHLIRKHEPHVVYAGLKHRWKETVSCVYKEGKTFPLRAPLTALDTAPVIMFDNNEIVDDDSDYYNCFYRSREQTELKRTKWPEYALRILREPETPPEKNYRVYKQFDGEFVRTPFIISASSLFAATAIFAAQVGGKLSWADIFHNDGIDIMMPPDERGKCESYYLKPLLETCEIEEEE